MCLIRDLIRSMTKTERILTSSLPQTFALPSRALKAGVHHAPHLCGPPMQSIAQQILIWPLGRTAAAPSSAIDPFCHAQHQLPIRTAAIVSGGLCLFEPSWPDLCHINSNVVQHFWYVDSGPSASTILLGRCRNIHVAQHEVGRLIRRFCDGGSAGATMTPSRNHSTSRRRTVRRFGSWSD